MLSLEGITYRQHVPSTVGVERQHGDGGKAKNMDVDGKEVEIDERRRNQPPGSAQREEKNEEVRRDENK